MGRYQVATEDEKTGNGSPSQFDSQICRDPAVGVSVLCEDGFILRTRVGFHWRAVFDWVFGRTGVRHYLSLGYPKGKSVLGLPKVRKCRQERRCRKVTTVLMPSLPSTDSVLTSRPRTSLSGTTSYVSDCSASVSIPVPRTTTRIRPRFRVTVTTSYPPSSNRSRRSVNKSSIQPSLVASSKTHRQNQWLRSS